MQCTYTSWVPIASPPSLKFSNSKLKLSTTSPVPSLSRHHYSDSDGEGDRESSASVKFPSLPPHVKSITSTSNPFVKHCVKLLRSSPYRHLHGSTLVVGTTPIREINQFQDSLPQRTAETECLLLLDETEVPEGLQNSSARMLRVSSVVMQRLSQLQSAEAIDAIALMRFPTSYVVLDDGNKNADCRKWFPSPHRILVLEGIQVCWFKFFPFSARHMVNWLEKEDPGNLGTLIRSAVAFRWGGVFLLPGCCDPFNSKALKASRGASFQVPIVSGTWYHLEALIEEYQMKLLAGHPDSDDESKAVSRLSQGFADRLADVPLCLVLGNEGCGLSEKAQKECELVSIPMAGEFESLNVAVAGGIFLYTLQLENQRIA